jgi:hypothetical protein
MKMVRKWWTGVFWEWEEKSEQCVESGVVFQQREENEKLLIQWCFSNRRGKAKQLLDGVVSSMKDGEGMVEKGFRAVMGEKGVSLVFQ